MVGIIAYPSGPVNLFRIDTETKEMKIVWLPSTPLAGLVGEA
jgi:hypothetical protein